MVLATLTPKGLHLLSELGDVYKRRLAQLLSDMPAIQAERLRHILASIDADEMAEILVDVLGRLDRLFDDPMPYMMWIHQRPTDGGEWPHVHLHVHIAPHHRAPGTPRYVAAGELGSGVLFNPVGAEEAAAQLRAL